VKGATRCDDDDVAALFISEIKALTERLNA